MVTARALRKLLADSSVGAVAAEETLAKATERLSATRRSARPACPRVSELYFMTLSPTASSWEGGDRTVLCVLQASESGVETMTGSMRGSGR